MARILYEQDQKDISGMFVKRVLAIDKANELANELEVLLDSKKSLKMKIHK